MRKEIDILSKNLAGGMSRRKALWHFLSSIGAAGAAGVLGAKRAKADNSISLLCEDSCSTQSQEFLAVCHSLNGNNFARESYCNQIASEFYTACLQATYSCRAGFCGEFVGFNGRTLSDAAYTSFINGDQDFTCTATGGGGLLG